MSSGSDVEKNENFVLDVRVVEVINNCVFRAALENGHTLVAYVPRHGQGAQAAGLKAGDGAQVRMSPFDMSRGELVFPKEMSS